jgi:hypothetical protein
MCDDKNFQVITTSRREGKIYSRKKVMQIEWANLIKGIKIQNKKTVSPFIHGFQISRHSIELGCYRIFVIQFLYMYIKST